MEGVIYTETQIFHEEWEPKYFDDLGLSYSNIKFRYCMYISL